MFLKISAGDYSLKHLKIPLSSCEDGCFATEIIQYPYKKKRGVQAYEG